MIGSLRSLMIGNHRIIQSSATNGSPIIQPKVGFFYNPDASIHRITVWYGKNITISKATPCNAINGNAPK